MSDAQAEFSSVEFVGRICGESTCYLLIRCQFSYTTLDCSVLRPLSVYDRTLVDLPILLRVLQQQYNSSV